VRPDPTSTFLRTSQASGEDILLPRQYGAVSHISRTKSRDQQSCIHKNFMRAMTNERRRCIKCTIEKTVVCFTLFCFCFCFPCLSFFFFKFLHTRGLGLLFLDGLLHLRRCIRLFFFMSSLLTQELDYCHDFLPPFGRFFFVSSMDTD
jgi:hypothetical protein